MESPQAFGEIQEKGSFERKFSYKCLECPAAFQHIHEVETHSFQEHFNIGLRSVQWEKSPENRSESLQETLKLEVKQNNNQETKMEELNGKSIFLSILIQLRIQEK